MPYKDDIFRELEAVLANAEPEQIKHLLADIAQGRFSETAQTRAGGNDNRANVTDMVHAKSPEDRHVRSLSGGQLSVAAREKRRAGYSS